MQALLERLPVSNNEMWVNSGVHPQAQAFAHMHAYVWTRWHAKMAEWMWVSILGSIPTPNNASISTIEAAMCEHYWRAAPVSIQ